MNLGDRMSATVVRVIDATLHAVGGPVHVVVTGLTTADEVLEAVSKAGAQARIEDGRLIVVARASQLVDAAGRSGGSSVAEPLRARLDDALGAWAGRSPVLHTPMGDLPTDTRPVVIGIVNVTPDSFSDGGDHADADAAVAHGQALAEAGADVVDVGGESSRPGADAVGLETELARVLPVVQRLAADGLIVSIDTTKAEVARRAVAVGAAMVNDISAGRLDDDLIATVASLGVPYVLMHMQGTPRTMQDAPRYGDAVAEVFDFLAGRLERFQELGLDPEHVVVDPGIGFGKSTEHNLALLHGLRQLASLGRPVLVGASRKRFLGDVTGVAEPAARGTASAAVAAIAVANGARLLRVHDVAQTVEAVQVAHAIALAGADHTAPDAR
ncbi:MAG: dihydropteroate synthase [Nitriliruptoraceae bacterium]|jgi:dihydropteroate synthase